MKLGLLAVQVEAEGAIVGLQRANFDLAQHGLIDRGLSDGDTERRQRLA